MAASRWTLALSWVQAALVLVVLVIVLLYLVVGRLMGRLISVADTEGLAPRNWARLESLFELAGSGRGLIIIVIVWLMVTKPS